MSWLSKVFGKVHIHINDKALVESVIAKTEEVIALVKADFADGQLDIGEVIGIIEELFKLVAVAKNAVQITVDK